MRNSSYLHQIHDIFFISENIKRLNSFFRLFYNSNNKKYEVRDIKNNYRLVVSCEYYPDQRLINKLFETNQTNMAKLFKEIEEHNKYLENSQKNLILDKSKQQLSEILNYYTNNPGKDLTNKQIQNIIETR